MATGTSGTLSISGGTPIPVESWCVTPFPVRFLEDSTALAILTAWKRRPWEIVHRNALHDRLCEIDREDLARMLDRLDEDWHNTIAGCKRRDTRNATRRWLKRFSKDLDWMLQPLPCWVDAFYE